MAGVGARALTRSYLRFEQSGDHGVIAWPPTAMCLSCVFSTGSSEPVLAVAAGLGVLLWSPRRGVVVRTLRSPDGMSSSAEVSTLSAGLGGLPLVAGYSTGHLALWPTVQHTSEGGRPSFCAVGGHRPGSKILCVSVSPRGTLAASGAADTSAAVWDLTAGAVMFRLKGHRGAVNGLAFVGGEADWLVTAGGDGALRLWDLTQRTAIQTLCLSASPLYCLAVCPTGTRLFVGSAEREVRAFDATALDRSAPSDVGEGERVLKTVGVVTRVGTRRMVAMAVSPDGQWAGLLAHGRTIELLHLLPATAAARRARIRARRRRRQGASGEAVAADGEQPDEDSRAPSWVKHAGVFALASVVKAFVFLPGPWALGPAATGGVVAGVACTLADNSLEVWGVGAESAARRTIRVSAPGHRGEVKCVSLSGGAQRLVSVSTDGLRLWERSGDLVCRIDSPEGKELTCVAMLPGIRHGAVGTRTGELLLAAFGSSSFVSEVEAHKGALTAIDILPSGQGLATGGADKWYRLWEFEVAGAVGERRLAMRRGSGVQLVDGVTALAHSVGERQRVAVGLLDCTVRVLYGDTLRSALTLYGHRLPVTSVSFTSDELLLFTASMDKTVKIWGMDFGDCRKSLLAHSDYAMAVCAVPFTHLFFSAGREGAIHMWDADHRTLEAHKGAVWSMRISDDGGTLVSAGKDRAVRWWIRTAEPLFPIEEREREREEALDEAAADAAAAMPPLVGEDEETGGGTGHVTAGALKAGESLGEAVELVEREMFRPDSGGGGNPMLLGMEPLLYFAHVASGLSANDVDGAVAALSTSQANALLLVLKELVTSSHVAALSPEQSHRLLNSLVRHHLALAAPAAGSVHASALVECTRVVRGRLQTEKDVIGFNLAGLSFMQRLLERGELDKPFFALSSRRGYKRMRPARPL